MTIVAEYQAAVRGLAHYCLLAQNGGWLWRLHWVMRSSLLKTLAYNHRGSVQRMQCKYRAEVEIPHGCMSCLRGVVERGATKTPLVAPFGGIPLRRQLKAVLNDQPPKINTGRSSELLTRLLADTRERCGSQQDCQVHHFRKLADLKRYGRREQPVWIQIMASRRHKTLVVCRACHLAIYSGKPRGRVLG